MPNLPGWDSLDAVTRIHNWAEIFGIVSLALLVATEVLAYMYGHRQGDLINQAQDATERRHNEEMARLHLETAEANDRATQANLQLERLKRPRLLLPNEQNRLVEEMRRFSGQFVGIGAIPGTFEAASFAEQLVRVLLGAGIQARINQQMAANEVGISRGVVARFVTGNPAGEGLAMALCTILMDAGIAAHAVGGRLEENVLKNRWKRDDAELSAVVVVVGDKE
jgi:hypothetical protein